jgi:hypothetical protein
MGLLCLFSHLLSPHLIGVPLLLTSSLDLFLLLLLWGKLAWWRMTR